MSIHHLEQAAEAPLHATTKLVLMALADDANKLTRVTFPGRPKLCLWARISDRRAQQIIEELIIRGYLARKNFGMPGRNAEYLVFPTDEELEQLDTINPDLNSVSQNAIDAVKRADTAEAKREAVAEQKAAERATERAKAKGIQPVDNPEGVGAMGCTHKTNNGCNPDTKGCNPDCTPPVSTPVDLIASPGESLHNAAPVENPTDDHTSAAPKPKATGSARRGIDVAALAALTSRCFPGLTLTTAHIEQLADRIVAKAASPVVDRTAYVAQALSRHATEWRSVALDLIHGISDGRLENGNDF